MTNKEARDFLLKEFDKSCGNYSFQNAHKIDLEEAMYLGAKALEKQTPKKPINYDSVPHSRCPVCHNAVKVFEDAHESHYCPYCGQELDWR